MNPFLALIITFVLALGWLRLLDFCAHRGWIESHLSRKIIHIAPGRSLSCAGSYSRTSGMRAGWRRWCPFSSRSSLC